MPRKPCTKTTEELKAIIRELLPLAEAGEFHTGGKREAEALRNAKVLADARKAAEQ